MIAPTRQQRARTLDGGKPRSSGPPLRESAAIGPGSSPSTCLVCCGDRPRRLFFRSGKWFWFCRYCELVFVHDIHPECDEDLTGLDDPACYTDTRTSTTRKRRKLAHLLGELEPYRQRNRLLDVGCSVGTFLDGARERGWRCSGIEILLETARYAREERGLDVRAGELRDARFPSGEFDVVYMNEVIEHIVDPVELMTEVRRVLRPGGVALVRTGNAASWSARLRGADWGYYRFEPHGHIRYYSPKAAHYLARATGFARVDCRTHGFALRGGHELEGRSRRFKLFVKLAQSPVSPWARLFGRGHRLSMRFHTAAADAGPGTNSQRT